MAQPDHATRAPGAGTGEAGDNSGAAMLEVVHVSKKLRRAQSSERCERSGWPGQHRRPDRPEWLGQEHALRHHHRLSASAMPARSAFAVTRSHSRAPDAIARLGPDPHLPALGGRTAHDGDREPAAGRAEPDRGSICRARCSSLPRVLRIERAEPCPRAGGAGAARPDAGRQRICRQPLRRPAQAHRPRPHPDGQAEDVPARRADGGRQPVAHQRHRRRAGRHASGTRVSRCSSSSTTCRSSATLCDEVYVLAAGSVIAEGTPDAIQRGRATSSRPISAAAGR